MGIGRKLKKGYRRFSKKFRRTLGLTSKNKWLRQLRRSLGMSSKGHTVQDLGSSSATSATTEGYKYSGNSISQLMGGV